MAEIDDLQGVAVDRNDPISDRLVALGRLSKIEPATAERGRLQSTLLVLVFDEGEAVEVRVAAAEATSVLGWPVVNQLARSSSPHQPEVRRAMVASLRSIAQRPAGDHAEASIAADLARLEHDLTTFPFVNLTLRFGADPRIVPVLHRGLGDPDPQLRSSAVLQLARIGDPAPAVAALGADADPEVRAAAADALGWYWTGEAEPIAALRAATTDPDRAVARSATAALRRLHLEPMARPGRGVPLEGAVEVDPRYPWAALLGAWSHELCSDQQFALTQPDEVIESGWTGSGPASDEAIRDLEARLGRRLPPSYRSFLQTTDGFVGGGSVDRIRPASEVRPFVEEEAEWVEIWLDSAGGEAPMSLAEHVASQGEDPVWARWSLLAEAIQVSDVFDGAVYLLCPSVTDERGEWEAWCFANWLPGADRHASWWDLLSAERAQRRT